MRALFGDDPPRTIDVGRAARICVDGLLVGHTDAARIHGIGIHSITRLHRMRDESTALDEAVKRELVATPSNLSNRRRLSAWAERPLECGEVDLNDDGCKVRLVMFIPAIDTEDQP